MSNLILHQDALYRLMMNKFSNYFVQALFVKATNAYKAQIINKLLSDEHG